LFSQIEKAKDKNETLQIISENPDYLILEDDQIVLNDKTPFDYLFTSPDKRFFFIGETIYFFYQGYQYIIYDGDVKKVEMISKGLKSIENVLSISSGNKKARINLASLYNRVVSNTESNRRGTVEVQQWGRALISTGQVNSQGQALFRVYIEARTQAFYERRTLGLWSVWNSNNTLKVNYFATLTYNGSAISSTVEPNLPAVTVYGHYHRNFQGLYTPDGFRVTQLQSNNVSIDFQSRNGYYLTPQVPQGNIVY
jgi:hypothetical protein